MIIEACEESNKVNCLIDTLYNASGMIPAENCSKHMQTKFGPFLTFLEDLPEAILKTGTKEVFEYHKRDRSSTPIIVTGSLLNGMLIGRCSFTNTYGSKWRKAHFYKDQKHGKFISEA